MKYFKNTELAKLYHVSEKTVRNWIDAAQEGKLDLQLHQENDRAYIANTAKNNALIEELVIKGKKFKNRRGFKTITPRPEFYDIYDQQQILDIISNIVIRHEVPTRYSYANGGAKYWDEYAKRLSSEQTPNILTETQKMLEMNSSHLDELLSSYDLVNVVDLGPGNGLPAHPILERLLKQKRLNRYVAIDCSKEMLDILKNNVENWFDGAVNFEGHLRDFSYERFNDLLLDYPPAENKSARIANLVLLFGGTVNNFRSPNLALQNINYSLGLDDILIYSGYIDTPNNRRYFDFATSHATNQTLRTELILNLLGIDESLIQIERKFDETKKARSKVFKPKVDLSIELNLKGDVQHIELRKGEPILLWRHWHKSTVELINQLDQNSFDLMSFTKSPNGQYALLVSKVKTNGAL